MAFGQAIADALRRIQRAKGGASAAALFDGREGKEVAESTLSRWIGDPSRFPAVFLPVLVEYDTEFRAYVFQHIAARMIQPAQIAEQLTPQAREEYERARDELTRRIWYGPGGLGERY